MPIFCFFYLELSDATELETMTVKIYAACWSRYENHAWIEALPQKTTLLQITTFDTGINNENGTALGALFTI